MNVIVTDLPPHPSVFLLVLMPPFLSLACYPSPPSLTLAVCVSLLVSVPCFQFSYSLALSLPLSPLPALFPGLLFV